MKIIDIMSHQPNYKAYKENRPPVNWNVPGGKWVGIWESESSDIIASEILKADSSIEYEIWQPDLRADKIYSHSFDNGLIHKLFPAKSRKSFNGLRIINEVYSDEMLDELEKLEQNDVILVLDAAPLYINKYNYTKLKNKFPILNCFSADPVIYFKTDSTSNPIKKISRKLLKKQRTSHIKKLEYVMMADIPESVEFVKKNLNSKLYTNIFGIDFNSWKINKTKEEARKVLNLPGEPFIIFSSSRLVSVKQIDKLIEVFSKLKEYNFQCYISGHGTIEYEKYLRDLIESNQLSDRVFLLGYIDDTTLLDYYLACDLFATTSRAEGGPISAWKAASIEVPLFTTKTGNIIKLLEENNAGVIVSTSDYNEWEQKLKEILEGKKVKVIDRNVVEKIVSWEYVAKRYLNIYREIFKNFHQKN